MFYEQFYQMIKEASDWAHEDPTAFVNYVEGALTIIERMSGEKE